MTDHDDDDTRRWFRGAVDPVLDTHPPEDRWAALRRRAQDHPPLVVALVPRRRRDRAWLAVAAAAVLLVAAALLLLAGRSGEDTIVAPPTTDSSTAPPTTTTAPTTTAPTTTTAPPGPLVEVPAVESRIDLASYGLDVRYLDRATTTVAEGDVVSQDPAAGSQVPEGSLVVVIMSGGGPVTSWDRLPEAARTFSASLPDYRTTEPVRLVPTSGGDAYKTDAWLFGPCAAVDEAARVLLDPSYQSRCY